MSREFAATSFFNHSSFINTHYAAQIPLEYFLADVLLRHDLSRIVYSSNEYAFRRRFELTAGSGGELTATSLNLPFVNYWYSDSWQPDDRPFAMQTAAALRGLWLEGFPSYLKIIPVKALFIGTAFYSRDDDARFAYEALLREFRPKGPIQLATEVTWKDKTIAIPVYVTLEQPRFNPRYKETDWLKTQRMLPVEFSFNVRSYLITPDKQALLTGEPSLDPTPPFNTIVAAQRDDDEISISEEVILNFAAAKQWGELPAPDSAETADLNEVDSFTIAEQVSLRADPRVITTDIVTGYFEPISEFEVVASVETPVEPTSATINWTIDPESIENFQFLEIAIPGQTPIIIDDPIVTSATISNLSPSSIYDITLIYHTVDGGIKTILLTATTAEDPDNPADSPLTKRKGRLKGMEW